MGLGTTDQREMVMAYTRVISGKKRQVGESRYRKEVELTGVGSLINREMEAEKRVWNDSDDLYRDGT